jgi:hypothetical protein
LGGLRSSGINLSSHSSYFRRGGLRRFDVWRIRKEGRKKEDERGRILNGRK